MDHKHYQILKYLQNRADSVSLKEFPNEITSEYSYGIREGSLLHELEIILKNKGWIKTKGYPHGPFWLTPDGKKALEREDVYQQHLKEQTPSIVNNYNVQQAGAVGPHSVAHDNTFNQKIQQLPVNINYEQVAAELLIIKNVLESKLEKTSEDHLTIATIAGAEEAAKKKDDNKLIKNLTAGGKQILEISKEIGVAVVAEVVKKLIYPGS